MMMKKYSIIAVLLLLFSLHSAAAQENQNEKEKDMGGWEISGAYNRLYKNSERDRLKGEVTDIIEFTPMTGMSPGTGLIVRDQDGDKISVHLGPRWFVEPGSTGIRKGDAVKIKGVWAEIGGKDIFMAAKVKKGEYSEYKIRRTKDGMPFWVMSKEELEKEQSAE
ncbi:MAG: hypothetical protein V2I97_11830 [Desulfococcaceae bacterium]|jgi:hypothetical protein|nr:hypothetical protein [Desulfococcaceae bacterium]